ncbi:hypothetical protein [Mycobacterium simiae]|uniref:hypothetical protein n=1 Tax=Mycobacterium simiae TaxID=1784 RepID=UPI00165FCD4D|nr:hypothetical protein [Mycobacterium simiae]
MRRNDDSRSGTQQTPGYIDGLRRGLRSARLLERDPDRMLIGHVAAIVTAMAKALDMHPDENADQSDTAIGIKGRPSVHRPGPPKCAANVRLSIADTGLQLAPRIRWGTAARCKNIAR